MENIGKQITDREMKRRLFLGAYLVVAIPASGLVWKLLSPAHQQEQPLQVKLPMRDAVAPLPLSESSLTPPVYGDEELSAAAEVPQVARAAAATTGRGAPAVSLADKLARLLDAEKDRQAKDGAGAGEGGGKGRLGALSGLSSGSGSGGGGGQSGSAFGGGRFAPILAGAGPSGSVGLVTTGASKRFSPARLQRGGAVNGFTGGSRQAAGRLVTGASANNPQFDSAGAPGGVPGFSAGNSVAGGAASVGGSAISSMGGLPEGENNSSINSGSPTLPLAPVTPVGPAVDAGTGGSTTGDSALMIARCEAFKEGAAESSKVLETVRDLAEAGAKNLKDIVGLAKSQATSWKTAEDTLVGKFPAVTRQAQNYSDCFDVLTRVNLCTPAKDCLDTEKGELQKISGDFSRDITTLDSANSNLSGAPPKSENGYTKSIEAIDLEKGFVTGNTEIVQHATTGLNACLAKLPVTGCRKVYTDPVTRERSCDYAGPFGVAFRAGISGLHQEDMRVNDVARDALNLPWCSRYGRCDSVQVTDAINDLTDYAESFDVWGAEAPAGPLSQTTAALTALTAAKDLLANPNFDYSKNMVNGYLQLKKAHDSLDKATKELEGLREAACKGIQ